MRTWTSRYGVALCASLALVLGCKDGNGGPTDGGDPEATLAGPVFTSTAGVTETARLSLETNQPAAGLQVDVVTNPAVIPSIRGVSSAGRVSTLETIQFQNLALGRTRILLFDPAGGASIPDGRGPVLTLSFRIPETAPIGDSPIGLENGIVIDEEDRPFQLTLVPGQVTVQP